MNANDETRDASVLHHTADRTSDHVAPPSRTAGEVPDVPGYTIRHQLGEGGMAVVYAARDAALDRDVAIKVMKPGHSATRFVVESRITAKLPHPNIPPVHALGALADGRPYLAMKLVSGQTLTAELKGAVPADRPRLLGYFEAVCQAVGFAHARGLIHRDLKPSNVMVGAFGEVQVMDWGLAKEVSSSELQVPIEHGSPVLREPHASADAQARADIATTVAGEVKGTPAYMAPEQARGEPVDARADVFALGGILAAILTGRPPFAGTNATDTILRAARADLGDTLARLDECGADAELRALAKRCLAARAADRPADGAALAADVAAYRAAVEERLRRAERERVAAEAKAEEQRKRRRVQYALAASVLLLTVAGASGAVIASLWRDSEANRKEAVTQRDAADAAKDAALIQKAIADTAKDDALKQKALADTAKETALELKGIADKAKANEEVARKVAERERDRAAAFEYGSTFRVAQQVLREHDLLTLRALLDGTTPELRGWEWGYLDRLCDPSLVTLKGHASGVYWAALSPTGARAVTASYDKTAKVWDTGTGAVVLTLNHGNQQVTAAAFSADGARVVTGALDQTAKVWDAETGQLLLTFRGHPNHVRSVAFSPDGARVVTASNDKTAKVWDAKTGDVVLTLKGHTHFVCSAAYSANGARIVTGSQDNTARVWDAKTGALVYTFTGHTDWVTTAALSADASRVVTASRDKTAKVWDVPATPDGGAAVLTLPHTAAVNAAAFSPDGARVVTASTDKTAKVWDAKTGAECLALVGHTDSVTSAAFATDGARVVTTSLDKTAKVWDAKRDAEVIVLKGHPNAIGPDKARVVATCANGSRVAAIGLFGSQVTPKNTVTTSIVDAGTGKVVCTLRGHTKTVRAAAFCATGARVVTGSDDKTAKVWDATTGANLTTLTGHISTVTAVALSANGSRVATSCSDRIVRVWDATTGAELFALGGHTAGVTSVAFSADGRHVATTSDDRTARVWDATTGAELLVLKGHTAGVNAAAFTEDGARIVTLGADNVRVWDARAGAEVLALKGTLITPFAPFRADGTRNVVDPLTVMGTSWDIRRLAEYFKHDSVRPVAPAPRPK